MASTTFVDKSTVIAASWLNDVNSLVYTIFNGLTVVPTVGKIIRSNGTNLVGSTSTFADTYSVSTLLYASSANAITGLATANSATLQTDSGGIPSLVANATALTNMGGVSSSVVVLKSAYTAKGDVLVATAASTPAVKSVGTDGQALQADSSQSTGVVYIDNPSRPNLLINPNWQIDQINEGALYTISTTGVSGPDGWQGNAIGAGVFKLRTLADPDNAALKCLEITCTTADAAIAATDFYGITTAVEGYDAAALMAGTSSALPVTLQFKFKTNVTGMYGIGIRNSAHNRRYIGVITVPDSSEHEYSLSFTMDTTGTWLYTNGVGVDMTIVLAAGSNFQSTAGAWAGSAEVTTSAQCNFMSVNTNIAYLKRVQLIQGALVQAYKPADIQKELAKAERYYAKTFPVGTAVAQSGGLAGALQAMGTDAAGGAVGGNNWQYPQRMRANPTVVTYNPSAANANWRDVTNAADRIVTVDQGGAASDRNVGLTASFAAASCLNYIHATANARLV